MGYVIGALDIGTSVTRLYAGEVVNQKLKVLACSSIATVNMRKGTIRSIDDIVKNIVSVQKKMTAEHKIDLYDVVISFTSPSLMVQMREGHKMILSGHEIDEQDVADAEANATAQEEPDATEVSIQRFRQKYTVNGQPVSTPLGMMGTNLVANVLDLMAPRSSYEAIKTAVHRAGLRMVEIYFSGVAAMEAVVDMKMRSEGAIVIDIGAGITDYVVVNNGVIATTGTLGVGGAHLTTDLATAFQVPQKKAEEMKLAHGSAMLQPDLARDRYPLDQVLGSSQRSVSVHAIQTVTTERVDELLRIVHDALAERNILHHIHGGVFLTGGTAALPGIAERAAQIFQCPCRLGVPTDVDLTDEIRDEPYLHATGVGLLKFRASQLAQMAPRTSVLKRIMNYFKH